MFEYMTKIDSVFDSNCANSQWLTIFYARYLWCKRKI